MGGAMQAIVSTTHVEVGQTSLRIYWLTVHRKSYSYPGTGHIWPILRYGLCWRNSRNRKC